QRPAPAAHRPPRGQTRDDRGGAQPAGDDALPALRSQAVRGLGRRALRHPPKPRATGPAHGPKAPTPRLRRGTQTAGRMTFSEQRSEESRALWESNERFLAAPNGTKHGAMKKGPL